MPSLGSGCPPSPRPRARSPPRWPHCHRAGAGLTCRMTATASPAASGFALGRRSVLLIGVLCSLSFLGEGAVLRLERRAFCASRGFCEASGGLGYAAFSVTMGIGRLSGDALVMRFGPARVLRAGGALARGAGSRWPHSRAGPRRPSAGSRSSARGRRRGPGAVQCRRTRRRRAASVALAAVTTIGYMGAAGGSGPIGLRRPTLRAACGARPDRRAVPRRGDRVFPCTPGVSVAHSRTHSDRSAHTPTPHSVFRRAPGPLFRERSNPRAHLAHALHAASTCSAVGAVAFYSHADTEPGRPVRRDGEVEPVLPLLSAICPSGFAANNP